MNRIIGFIAPIVFALLIIIACKKEEIKECPPPANTFSVVYNDSLLTINFAVNDQGLTEVELGEVGFLPGTGLRTSGTTGVVYPAIPRSKEYQYYVRTDCGDGNYSYWVGPLDLNTFCYGEATDYTSTVQDSSVTIIWNNAPKLVEIEYGLEGFARGTGNFTNSDLESLTINKLSNGRYSFYGRSVCDDDSYGPWRGPYSFEITAGTNFTCVGATNFVAEVTDISATISFTLNQEYDIVEIEYGPGGTIQGSGTIVSTIAGENNITITDLSPNTEYVYYARTFCRQTNSYSEWKGRYFFETEEASGCPIGLVNHGTAPTENVGYTNIFWEYISPTVEAEIKWLKHDGTYETFLTIKQGLQVYHDTPGTYIYSLRTRCTDDTTKFSTWIGPFKFDVQ